MDFFPQDSLALEYNERNEPKSGMKWTKEVIMKRLINMLINIKNPGLENRVTQGISRQYGKIF